MKKVCQFDAAVVDVVVGVGTCVLGKNDHKQLVVDEEVADVVVFG